MAVVTGMVKENANASIILSGALDNQESEIMRLRELVDKIEHELLGVGMPDRNPKPTADQGASGLIPITSKRVQQGNSILGECNERLYHICNELGIESQISKRTER